MASVLIVEDESLVALDLQCILQDLGYRVTGTAASFDEAVQAAESARPDIVLMDIRLKGGRDGIQAADMIRARFGSPVIFLTSHGDAATVARAKAVNPYGYLLKPFTERELAATLEIALQRHSVERQLAEQTALLEQAMEQLNQQTQLLQSILENIGDGVVAVDSQRKLLIVNAAAKRIVPYLVGDQLPTERARQMSTSLPDSSTPFPAEEGPLTRALDGHPSDSVDMVTRAPSGELRSYNVTTRPVEQDGCIVAAVAVFRDSTERKQAQDALQESERWYRTLSDASFEGVAVTEANKILETNATLAGWLGYESAELAGTAALLLFAEEDRERVLALSTVDQVNYDATMLRRDGSALPVEVRGRFVVHRGVRVRIVAIRDVTEKKHREAQLREQAEQLRDLSLRDELTGLLNRRGFVAAAEAERSAAIHLNRGYAVFFADLNGLKRINDELGHEAGDHAIRSAALILSNAFAPGDVVARLGGDEFATFSHQFEAEAEACVRVEAAVAAFNASSAVRYRLSISIGVAISPPSDGCSLSSLMETADADMYERKRARHARGSLRVRSR